MKKVISVSILMIFIFFVFQWGITFLKKGHKITYQVSMEDRIFEIEEVYQDNLYNIIIKNNGDHYFYLFKNSYNKQQKIIDEIRYYQEEDYHCVYPILDSHEGTYLQCIMNNTLYTDVSFPNQDFIERVKSDLEEKGFISKNDFIEDNTSIIGNSTVYTDHLLKKDIITLWNYKGIEIIKSNNSDVKNILNFDKYENSHGFLVGKYYMIPNYLNSKVLEFDSLTQINIETNKVDTIELNNTLSADTYVNGIVDDKIYFMDPTNLLQMEIYPAKKGVRLIGSKELGGQIYQGDWQNINIYDLAKEHILFQKKIPVEVTTRYSFHQIIETNTCYYFINENKVYRVAKTNLDTPVLLFERVGLNNIKVIDNTVYFVVGDTLYYYEDKVGIIPVLKNNELRYNNINRIDIYRKI